MKNIIWSILLFLALSPLTVLAWDDCPLGIVNDPYPGDCGKYVDTDKNGICDHSESDPNKELAENSLKNNVQENQIANSKTESETSSPKYNLFVISVWIIIFYLISYFSVKKGKIELIIHKKIWNILLLLNFSISGLLGILLVLKIDYDIVFDFPFNILFWHVEFGIAIAMISFFHILERIKCFKI